MGRPVIFGEVLFDEFENGERNLGGAPFNVAWHLTGFGLNPFFVSRIGNDSNGKQILQTMEKWGMDNSGVQTDNHYPTGRVTITLDAGQPTFNIIQNQAYDYIKCDNLIPEFDGSLLYHGSLATRSNVSLDALVTIKKKLQIPTYIDINLRKPWWDINQIKTLIKDARWVKLNNHELSMLMQSENVVGDESEQYAKKLCHELGLEQLILTLGEKGAYFISNNEVIFGDPVKPNKFIDTVGAGDAFSAVTILGIIQKWALPVTLERALTFASSVCEIKGAVIQDPLFYQHYKETWGM